MARITSYANDGSLDGADKVIGTDALDGSTKNFSLGSLATFVESETAYTAGTGIDVTNRVISATPYTAGTGISIANNVITNTVVNTDDVSFVRTVTLNGQILEFDGEGSGFTGNIDLTPVIGVAYTAGTGISISGNTINCTVTDTDTTYTAGSGIAIDGSNVISSTITPYSAPQEVIAASSANQGATTTVTAVSLASVGGDLGVDTVIIGTGDLQLSTNAIQNTGTSTVNLRIGMSAFVDVLSNNSDITYILQQSTDGSTWTNVKSVLRSKSTTGIHADSFFSYFALPASNHFRIAISSSVDGTVTLQQGSIFEFIVKE